MDADVTVFFSSELPPLEYPGEGRPLPVTPKRQLSPISVTNVVTPVHDDPENNADPEKKKKKKKKKKHHSHREEGPEA